MAIVIGQSDRGDKPLLHGNVGKFVDHAAIERKQEDIAEARSCQEQLTVVRKGEIVYPEARTNRANESAFGRPQLDGGIFARAHEKLAVAGIFKPLNLRRVTALHCELDRLRGWC